MTGARHDETDSSKWLMVDGPHEIRMITRAIMVYFLPSHDFSEQSSSVLISPSFPQQKKQQKRFVSAIFWRLLGHLLSRFVGFVAVHEVPGPGQTWLGIPMFLCGS